MTKDALDNPGDNTQSHNNNNNQSKEKDDGIDDEELLLSDEPSVTTDKEESQEVSKNIQENSGTEILDLGDTSNYDKDERTALFQKGLDYEKKGKQELALHCYFGCMKGLKRKTTFVLLPECLHNIADIYQAQGNYERAIHFAQAEKLFYESALIETEEIQKKIEEVAGSEDNTPPADLNDLNIDALRAEEYEHLARLCLDKNQAQLALEYAGKCAKIRQNVFGENHPKTKETLDFFASLYAEVGKEQYSDSFTLLDDITSEDYNAPEVIMSPSPGGEPVSILRQRTAANQKKDNATPGQAEREKKVRFHESVEDKSSQREEIASLTVTLILLIVCFLILLALGLWLYCAIDRNQTCYYMSSKIQSWIMSVRYFFHSHSTQKMAFSR